MAKRNVLLQLDSDAQPSVFDSVVAIDAGAEQLLRHGGVEPIDVRALVHGAIFTRGGDALRHTAIFIGGTDVATGELLLREVLDSFIGPLRVSVMLDANGANTTAAAAVLTASRHLSLGESRLLVLGATGPVGQRVVRLLAAEGARVRVGSRDLERARGVCQQVQSIHTEAQLEPVEAGSPDRVEVALREVDGVIAAGAAGVQLVSQQARSGAEGLKLAIDLNAVPPLGLEGIEPTDKAVERDGQICYGAIGVGGLKMKIHRAAIGRLFESNDQVLDAEQIFALGRTLLDA